MEIMKRMATNRLTLRLQSDLLDALKQNANKKDLTLNAMITNILSKNATYDDTVNLVSNITIPHDLLSSIVARIREPDMNEIVKDGPSIVKKLFDIMGIRYDIDHVIYNYFTMLSKYCNWFEFTPKIVGNRYRLVFCTGNNPKWSLFIQHYVKNILKSLQIIVTNESYHAGIIVFEFTHKDYV